MFTSYEVKLKIYHSYLAQETQKYIKILKDNISIKRTTKFGC